MSVDVLLSEYLGDRAWERFAATFQGSQTDPLGIDDETLARALSSKMGAAAKEWLQRPLPALDGRSPAWLLAHHPQGLKVIRAFVMRMPS